MISDNIVKATAVGFCRLLGSLQGFILRLSDSTRFDGYADRAKKKIQPLHGGIKGTQSIKTFC
jgi:hypothetical protein